MKKAYLFLLTISIGLMSVAQEQLIRVEVKRNDDKSVSFKYAKSVPGNYLLKLELSDLDNAYFSGFTRVISAYSGNLFTLKPIDPEKHINFSYRTIYRKGEPNPKVKEDIIYLFPFDSGQSVKILPLQNLKEKYFNSYQSNNWVSYQFLPETEDTVRCIRKGIVTEVIDEYSPDTTGMYSFYSKANKIEIEHPDGTYAVYTVLKRGSFTVEPGDLVFPGDPIAISGKINIQEKPELRLAIYYFTDEELDEKKQQNLFNSKEQIVSYITPIFSTNKGNRALNNGETYKGVISNELIEQELTKREKKKRTK